MLAQVLIEEFNQKVDTLREKAPFRDLEKNARAFHASALDKLNLVSREEFDVQVELLARTRETLEARIAELEARMTKLEAPADMRTAQKPTHPGA